MTDLFDEVENVEEINQEKPARWKSAISVIAVLVIVYVIFKMLMTILIPIVIGILLIANRDIVFKIIRSIYKLYKDETYKGLIATVLAVVGFVPFMVFLFVRTIYNTFIVEKQPAGREEEEEDNMGSKLITIAVKEKVKDILGIDEDENNK
jgi:predicted PurR-regulated permease PerM